MAKKGVDSSIIRKPKLYVFKGYSSRMWQLSRYVPRKVWHTLLYALFAIVLIIFYTTLPTARSRQFRSSDNSHLFDDSIGDPFIAYRNLPKRDYFDVDVFNQEQQREGPGERGAAVKLSDLDDAIVKTRDELYRQNGYDGYVSDQLALNRSVKDIRHKSCHGIKHIERLPSVSVIFPFHDEHFSTLLRSAYSVINRSPQGVVREVILVDDASTKEFLKEPLENYWKAQRMDHIVKVVRTSKREGLIRARLVGAKAATSDILIFLDAHSEANYNWLPPLIEPIAMDYRTVVCPFVDVIDCDTYEYRAQDEGARGSFDWEFNYKRLPLTDDDVKHPSRPFESPVMAGGYFAISTKWFWELGGYDEGLDIWGGEQYELSFKIWQCHGRLVDAPCSRVGHIYRCKYIPFPNPNVGDFISRNYRRVAEVWMDEYKTFLFDRKPLLKSTDPGNLDKQREVRTRLKCKSFDWFMKNVAFDQNEFYPAVEPLDGAEGQLKNDAIGKCVDANFGKSGDRVTLSECGSDSEELHYTFHEDIRPHGRTMCFDVSSSVDRAPVTLFACHGMRGNQYFKYLPETKQLHQHTSNMCMNGDATTGEVFMSACDSTSPTQRWTWTTLRVEVLEEWERDKKRKAEAKRAREARSQ